MDYNYIIFTVGDGVAEIRLNRPEHLNPLSAAAAEELIEAVNECAGRDDVRAVIISGAGRAFCGGGDIRYMAAEIDKPDADLQLGGRVGKLVLAIRRMLKPVICAVQGAAAGGGANLAFACDYVLAAENAKFVEAFVKIGLAPDTAGVYTLPRLIGAQKAFEIMSTGRPVKAEEAARLGLVAEVCPLEQLEERARALAAQYAAGPSKAYAWLKALMNKSVYDGLEEYLELEVEKVSSLAKTDDFREGIHAFLEKRPPVFTGK